MSVNRPLSPHLQVYRLPLTGLISITHRMTGEATYEAMQTFMAFWPCQWLYWGFIYALFFHLCHGVRHLIWDIGKTFDKATLTLYAVIELLASAALTLATFFLL